VRWASEKRDFSLKRTKKIRGHVEESTTLDKSNGGCLFDCNDCGKR